MVRESLTVAYRACGRGGAGVRGKLRVLRLVRVNVIYSRGGARGRRVTELAFVAGSGSERRLIAVWGIESAMLRCGAVDYGDSVDV